MLRMPAPEFYHLFPGQLFDWLCTLGKMVDRERRAAVVEGAD